MSWEAKVEFEIGHLIRTILDNRHRAEIPLMVDGSSITFTSCYECGYNEVEFDGKTGEQTCPSCHTWHLYENGKTYKLKPEEAFCYDFNHNRACM